MPKSSLIHIILANLPTFPHAIEIPENVECCTLLGNSLVFWKGNSFRKPGDTGWRSTGTRNVKTYLAEYPEAKIIWKQEPRYKEFLNSRDGYKLVVLPEHAGDDPKSGLIEVPDGAEIALKGERHLMFRRMHNGVCEVAFTASSLWRKSAYKELKECCSPVLWQRTPQDEKVSPITNTEIYSRTASAIADAALTHIRERATTYDSPEGERSAAKTAIAFNAITGHSISESEVFLLLQILKDVRQWQKETYHVDSAEDCIAYAALKAEALEKQG